MHSSVVVFWLLSWKNDNLCLPYGLFRCFLWCSPYIASLADLIICVAKFPHCLCRSAWPTTKLADFDSPFADPFDSSSADWLAPAFPVLGQVIIPSLIIFPGQGWHCLCVLVPPFLPPAGVHVTESGDTQGVDHTNVSSNYILIKTWYILHSLKHCIALKSLF